MQNLLKAYRLLDMRERRQALVMLGIVTVMALFDALGALSVMPFLAVLANPGLIATSHTLSWLHDALGFTDAEGFEFFLGLASFGLLIVSAVVRSVGFFLVNRFAQMRSFTIGTRLMETYLRQPYSYFLHRHSGDMAKELFSEINVLIGQVYQPATILVAQATVLSVLVVLLIAVNPLTALIGIAVLGGCYLVISALVGPSLRRAGKERAETDHIRFRTATEALGGIKAVKLLGRESLYRERFATASRQFGLLQARAITLSQVPRYGIEAVAFGGIILLALALMVQYRDSPDGALTRVLPLLGFYAFAGYRLLPALQGIYQAMSQIRFGVAALDSIADSLAHRDALPALPVTPATPLPFARAVEIRGLTYRYPRAEGASLTDINLTLPAGSTLGIVGSTGAGKTTFVDLFLGLLTPEAGEILVDGTKVTPENLRAWQADLGYVPQDIFLLDAPVTQNIALGLPPEDIDLVRVREAARMAQILDFIETDLPQGFETMVGERGVRLSGGQRQRIGIARALYTNPGILVFDEATSALDNLTEQEVVKAIGALTGTKTVLLIAHRISTVRDCDQILVLERGRMVGLGSYDSLYRDNAAFRRLVDAREVA
ncbi:ATP-binding cassette domain-containing protein [bacterium]|nr:ATP-binding cassette domain-containing protein [bacterium]